MKEEWRDVVSFGGVFAEAYQVSNMGNVRSKDRLVVFSDGRKRLYEGQKIKGRKNCYGYLSVILRFNGYSERNEYFKLL